MPPELRQPARLSTASRRTHAATHSTGVSKSRAATIVPPLRFQNHPFRAQINQPEKSNWRDAMAKCPNFILNRQSDPSTEQTRRFTNPNRIRKLTRTTTFAAHHRHGRNGNLSHPENSQSQEREPQKKCDCKSGQIRRRPVKLGSKENRTSHQQPNAKPLTTTTSIGSSKSS